MPTADNADKRSPKRIRDDADEIVQRVPAVLESLGLFDLILFGSIEIIVTNGKAQSIALHPSFRMNPHKADSSQAVTN